MDDFIGKIHRFSKGEILVTGVPLEEGKRSNREKTLEVDNKAKFLS